MYCIFRSIEESGQRRILSHLGAVCTMQHGPAGGVAVLISFHVYIICTGLKRYMQGDHLRKGRLGEGRPHGVTKFLSSMEADRWIADADLLVDIAHLIMLEKRRIIEPEPARALMKLLLELNEHGLPEAVYDPQYEDIHAGIEAYLISRLGIDHGGRLHMGRSRNDEVATCIRIRARDELLENMERIVHLRTVLLDLAARHAETAMP
jgi:argininosuccinate lyase